MLLIPVTPSKEGLEAGELKSELDSMLEAERNGQVDNTPLELPVGNGVVDAAWLTGSRINTVPGAVPLGGITVVVGVVPL